MSDAQALTLTCIAEGLDCSFCQNLWVCAFTSVKKRYLWQQHTQTGTKPAFLIIWRLESSQ